MTERQVPEPGTVDPAETDAAVDQAVDQAAEQAPATGDGGSATEAPAEAGMDAKIAELTTDLQRLQAEYVNYKRRVDRDRELVLQNAKLTILSALLPVLDDIDRAREHGELEGGFKAVADSLERIVAGQGLVKFGAPGDEFDPHRHEALMHGHSPDVTTSTCQNIVQAGYELGDRVVRPALVTVVDPEGPGSDAQAEPVVDQPDAVVADDIPLEEQPETKDE